MRTLLYASAAWVLCAWVSGCATPAASLTAVTAHKAVDAVIIGKSTKADVVAALGKTKGVSFDSGFEVWAYQVAGAADRTEFVVLFAPSGVVAKTRTRPGGK